MSPEQRERLTLQPIADDPEVGRWLAALEVAPDWAVHHILQHEAEHRSLIAWLRDTYPFGSQRTTR